MKQVQVETQVMVVIEIDKMSERLKKAYSLLVAIQKGLNAVSQSGYFHKVAIDCNTLTSLLVLGQEANSLSPVLLYLK